MTTNVDCQVDCQTDCQTDPRTARWCRTLLLVTLATLGLCSCRGVAPRSEPVISSTPVQESAVETPDGPTASIAGKQSDVPTAESSGAARTLSLSDDTANPAPKVRIVATSHAATATPVVLPFEVSTLPHEVSTAGYPQVAAQVVSVSAAPCPPHGPMPVQPPCFACGPTTSIRTRWIPPGLTPPWPKDEYLCDGGDQGPSVRVRKDWSVSGLDLEDTVAHYDTVDGQTHVEPSNRVCLYAPRFAAVRKVYGVRRYEGHERVAGIEMPTPIEGLDDVQIANTAIQPLQPELNRGKKIASGLRERTPPTMLDNAQGLVGTHGVLPPHEDFTIFRDGLMDNSEKARLAQRIQAAMAWSHDQAVQVLIDNIAAHVEVGQTAPESVHTYELSGSRLRICKVASRHDARPGEIVEFTLRFDNMGEQMIGNVTVIDNLTTRLEYVEGSQSCSLKANFSTNDNQGDSLVLRWEIVDPIKVGKGGIIRFKCRVR